MKYLSITSLLLLGSLTSAHAVIISIDGAVQGSGEFADYSSLSEREPITPDSSVTASGFTLTTHFDGGTGNGGVNWNTSYPGGSGMTYTVGQEINFRAGDDGDTGGDNTPTVGDNYFEIQLDGGSDFNWDSVSVDVWRNGSGAAAYYQFAYDDEGNGTYGLDDLLGSATTVSGSGATGTTPNELATISYSGLGLPTNISSGVGDTVRLYFWGATSNGGNTHMTNVSAEYSAIPEPHTYAFAAGLLGLGLAVIRRRRA